MKKLPHERLRDMSECNSPVTAAIFYMKCTNERDLFNVLADEIERYYIPRPRFEDGKPVNIGDELDYGDGTSAKVKTITVSSDGSWSIDTNRIAMYDGRVDRLLKRPSPKVLDADGVEIKVGDRVWSVQNGKQAIVSDIGYFETKYSKGNVMLEGVSECYMGTLFTHKKQDSLEKISQDLKKWVEYGGWSSDIKDISDRLAEYLK